MAANWNGNNSSGGALGAGYQYVRRSVKCYARIGWRFRGRKKMLIFTHGSKSHTNLRQRLIVS